MTDDDFMKFYSMEEQVKRRQEGLECIELAQEILNNTTTVEPIWHTNICDMNFKLQDHPLDKKYLVEGYSVIDNVGLDFLFDILDDNCGSFLRNGNDIFDNNKFSERSLCRITKLWKNNSPTIPATILIPEGRKRLFPMDGKHRLKLANFYGAKTIPILIPEMQKQEIVNLLNSQA